MKKHITLLIACFFAIFTSEQTFSQIVTSSADDGSEGTLRKEIMDTPSGGTVTFLPTVLEIDLNSEILIDKEITIYGTPVTTVVLDANSNGRIFNITGGPVHLENLTFNDGLADNGGAIYNSANLSIDNSVFSQNIANGTSGSGGAIYNDSGGYLYINESIFNSNQANRAGGAIEDNSGSGLGVVISEVTFNENNAGVAPANPMPGNGGAIHITGPGDIEVSEAFFNENIAALEGGALWNGSGVMTLEEVLIDGNIAYGDAADDGGGGIFNNGGTLILEDDVTVINNVASGTSGSGGGIFSTSGMVSITSSWVSYNTSNRAGGGIELIDGELNMLNVTLDENETGSAPGNGGGLHITGSANANITGGTVNGNIAASEGGGLWNGSGIMTIEETIIDGNMANGDAADNGGGGIFNNGGTLVLEYDVTVINNIASGTSGSGGGIFSTSGMVSVTSSWVSYNTSNRAGGGIELIDGELNMLNVTLDENETGSAPGNGGGLHITGMANSNITGGTVNGNIASREGGGLWNGSGTMTVDGAVIDGNMAYGDSADDGGAGIFNNGGTLMVQNGTMITYNIASGVAGSGGGILSVGGAISVNDSSILNNQSNRAGGGIELAGGSLNLTNVSLDMNNAGVLPAIAAPGSGGGLHITGSASATITGGTTNNNIAANEGGGLWNGSGMMTIVDHTIDSNSASGNDSSTPGAAGGGGIYNEGGMLDISGMTMITNNVADGAQSTGGGILNAAGMLLADGITIMDNTSNRAGGGIETNGAGAVTLIDVMLNSNDTGVITGTGAPGNGGGLHVSGPSTISITGGTVNMNTAASEGGGLWNGTGVMILDGTTIDGNTASGEAANNGGGGIYALSGGTLNLINGVTVSNNMANGTSGSGGGILVDVDASFSASDSFITNNQANRAGGGIEIVSGTGSAMMENTDLSMNNAGVSPAVAAPGNGGGLHITGAQDIMITGGMVNNNMAALEGGGLWNGTGMMTIDGVTIDGNIASGDLANEGGGGIFNAGGTLMVQNSSVISNNVADGVSGSGGGILNDMGSLSVTDSEISSNMAMRAGGGIEENSMMGSLLTLTNVDLLDNSTSANPGNGGGLHITGPGDSNIIGGMVNGNSASREGGGLWNGSGMMTVDGVTIDGNMALGNAADDGGAGIFNNGGTLNIMNGTMILNNMATGTSASGGGLLSTAGEVTIMDSTFDGNAANRAGGAIELIDGNLTFSNSIMMYNDVNGTAGTPAPGNGGGFHVTGMSGMIHIVGSNLHDNHAASQGGALWNQNGTTMMVESSAIFSNSANEGGGIYNNTGAMTTVMTTTISENIASSNGGGVASYGASLDIHASTIAMNTSSGVAGGIDGTHEVSLKNTIVALNMATSGMDIFGIISSNDYNLIGTDDLSVFMTQSNDILEVDPLLGPLQNNGGTTMTHQLLDSSPAFDAGDPMDTFVDQIGQAVFGDARDIGAFESQISLSISDFNSEIVMTVYPNPTQGNFNIVMNDNISGIINVQIVSMTGKVVKEQQLFKGKNSMDISGMASGIYIVNISSDFGKKSHKLVLR